MPRAHCFYPQKNPTPRSHLSPRCTDHPELTSFLLKAIVGTCFEEIKKKGNFFFLLVRINQQQHITHTPKINPPQIYHPPQKKKTIQQKYIQLLPLSPPINLKCDSPNKPYQTKNPTKFRMTSITSNVTSIPQASPSTNSSAPSSSSHARTPSVSGQTSSSAAVQASAPAQRQLSYATAASKKPTPVIAASPSSPHVPVGASAQNARPTSTASPAVNGKIPPTVANSGPAAANGTPNPFPGGHHSRKSSVASGAGGSMMPNGPPRGTPAITFGTLHEATGPASSGSAAAASNPSLTAPLASNQKASSPQSSPSPVVRPMATGGVPPGQATAASGRIQFGEATHHVSLQS